MTQALARRPERPAAMDSTALWLNVVIGLLIYMALYLLAPSVAEFYGLPQLCPLMRLVCLGVPLNALCVVQAASLMAALRFGLLCRISIVAAVVSGGIGIWLAACGFGARALAWQQVSLWGSRALLLWILAPGLKCFAFEGKHARTLTSFSWKVMASALINTVWTNLYPVIIARCFAARPAGLFWRARSMALLPAATSASVFSRVGVPMLGRAGGRPERLHLLFCRLLGMSAWVIFPCMALLAALARPLIQLLFTPEWLPVVPLLRLLALGSLFYPWHALNLSLLNVVGRSDLYLRLELIKLAMSLTALLAGLPFGVIGICWGILASGVLALIVNTWYSARYARAGLFFQFKLCLPSLALSALSAFAAHALSVWLNTVPLLAFLAGLFGGLALYLLGSLAFGLPWPRRLIALKI